MKPGDKVKTVYGDMGIFLRMFMGCYMMLLENGDRLIVPEGYIFKI